MLVKPQLPGGQDTIEVDEGRDAEGGERQSQQSSLRQGGSSTPITITMAGREVREYTNLSDPKGSPEFLKLGFLFNWVSVQLFLRFFIG